MTSTKPSRNPPPADEEDDAYTSAIKATGCFPQNEALQLCYYDSGRDWRACKKEMDAFRECMKLYTEGQQRRLKEMAGDASKGTEKAG
jgi:cytochrome c oxidase assembly factor 4